MKTWRLDDGAQTLVAVSRDGGLPEVIHWGMPLPPGEDLTALAAAAVLDVTGGMMDANAPLSICPEAGHQWPGQPGLQVTDAEGRTIQTRFQCQTVTCDGSTLQVVAQDASGLCYRASLALVGGMLRAGSSLQSDAPVRVHWLAAPVLPAWGDGLVDYAGRWIGEWQSHHHEWSPGIHMREARQGRSGHEHPPFALLHSGGARDRGDVRAFSYDWPGGHRMVAEQLPDGRRQMQFGHATGATQGLVTQVETATLTACYSPDGRHGAARLFQRHVRGLPGPAAARQPRPVHYNCWEAIYFDHDDASLREIATQAASLGAERFVLDDGWFGRRDDDTTSLGDWQIDPRKWPDGLRPFAEFVNALGMGFGLWFEPEMVNMDSDLYRAHPDWLLGPVDQTAGRQQYVLDMSREDVRDHLFDEIDAVLRSAPIEYVKWDHNRLLPVVDAAQAEGTMALAARLSAAHPVIEFENCSSGGGRIDLGMFAHFGRVWLSDSNDALERMRIQHEAAQFLPLDVTGSHVGPRQCHTSGRVIDISTRAWVAAQRHMGFEMDPRELSRDEADTLRTVTQWWKDNRDWRSSADILPLDSGDGAVIAEIQVAADGGRFVAFAGRVDSGAQLLPRPLGLAGLDPAARYEVTLVNRDDAVRLSRGAPALKAGSLVLSGAALMAQGVALPWAFPASIWVLEGKRIEEGAP